MDSDYSLEGPGEGRLIDRVRRTHERTLEAGEETDGADRDRPPLSDGLREAERRVVAGVDDDLACGLISTACEVIAEQFESDEAVREAVVDTVVEAKYGEFVAGDRREAIVAAVEETLTRDVMFRNEVEAMLMHAARHLGQAQKEQWARLPLDAEREEGP